MEGNICIELTDMEEVEEDEIAAADGAGVLVLVLETMMTAFPAPGVSDICPAEAAETAAAGCAGTEIIAGTEEATDGGTWVTVICTGRSGGTPEAGA